MVLGAHRQYIQHTMKTNIRVRYETEGFHRWKQAPDNRSYLRDLHRHLFKIEVEMSVAHNDREVEFHDLLDYCKSLSHEFSKPDNQNMSCEHHATAILNSLDAKYSGRRISVTVYEDGECGAIVMNDAF